CVTLIVPPPVLTMLPYTPLFRSALGLAALPLAAAPGGELTRLERPHLVEPSQADILDQLGGDLAVVERHDRLAVLLERLVALARSEEHTSELQSRENIVCRLLPE